LWSVVRRRDQWLGGLHQINVGMGLVVLAVTVASNTPLLNLQQWSANSQLARLERGLAPADLDLRYFRSSLGRAGYEALQELKQRYASDSKLIAKVDELYAAPSQAPQTLDELRSRLSVWPDGREIPAPVLADFLHIQNERKTNFQHAWLLFSDLDGDGQDEVVLVSGQFDWVVPQLFWSHKNGSWQQHRYERMKPMPPAALDSLIREGHVAIETPHWAALRIGDMTLVPQD
ncbi:MAG TPA: hypothetical protein VMH83_07715, partial [Candidatus Acidoferrum sp.]|nr:hypothetical protein [Candidatus Acidoferrum sp.]